MTFNPDQSDFAWPSATLNQELVDHYKMYNLLRPGIIVTADLLAQYFKEHQTVTYISWLKLVTRDRLTSRTSCNRLAASARVVANLPSHTNRESYVGMESAHTTYPSLSFHQRSHAFLLEVHHQAQLYRRASCRC
jgi:hypothetical protein